MSGADERRTLLGRLAGQGWFVRRGELVATTGLCFLLEEEPLRIAFLNHLTAQTGNDVSGVSHFIPEALQDDAGRPDLEGRDDADQPLVKIEAKFTAALSREQLLSFLGDLESHPSSHGPGVLVVLIPRHRKTEAQERVDSLPAADTSPPVAACVLTWDELFDVLNKAAATASDCSTAIFADLLQLHDLCKTLQGLDITPLGNAASGPGWANRRTDLERIVERVTAELSGDLGLLPTGEDSLYTFRRYINRGPGSWIAVSIVPHYADRGGSPLWLRYISKDTGFAEITTRLRSSKLTHGARHDQGHIWLPLTLPADVSGAAIVTAIVDQVNGINSELANI